MPNSQPEFAPRPMDEVKKELVERAKEQRNPFLYTIGFGRWGEKNGRMRSVDWLRLMKTGRPPPKLPAIARRP
jgi:hypothetical protein